VIHVSSIRLNRRFSKVAKGVIEKYEFEVGVLRDGIHSTARPPTAGLKTVAGGPARKQKRGGSQTVSAVSRRLRARLRFNFYLRPFRSAKNRDLLNMLKRFFDLCAGRSQAKRLENALQAVVRNPITRGDYGRNSPAAAKIKGFNRLMIDTGQLFRAIRARVILKGGPRV
jgi:hypothetical protein